MYLIPEVALPSLCSRHFPPVVQHVVFRSSLARGEGIEIDAQVVPHEEHVPEESLVLRAGDKLPADNKGGGSQCSSRRPPPVSLRLPSGSFGDPQTGAPDSARLDACSPHQRVCVPLDAAVTPL